MTTPASKTEELDYCPVVSWETYLERMRREMTDSTPDSPERETEYHRALGR